MTYQAEFEDGEMEAFDAENDKDARQQACGFEGEHGTLFNIFLLDDNYNEVKTIF